MSSGVLEVLQGQDGAAAVEMLLNLLSEAAAGRDVSSLAPEIIQVTYLSFPGRGKGL